MYEDQQTRIVRIDPDGTVDLVDGGDLLSVGRTAFDGRTDVITLRSPEVDASWGVMVGVVHDTGLLDGLPLNRKAWALYGRSPIYGPMFVAFDQDDVGGRDPLETWFIDKIMSDDYPTPPVQAAMTDWLSQHPEFPAS